MQRLLDAAKGSIAAKHAKLISVHYIDCVHQPADGKLMPLDKGCCMLQGQHAAKHAKRTAETEVDFKGRREEAAKQNDGAHSKGIELVVVLDGAGREGRQKGHS